jgi:hypothetical protein
LSKALLIPVGYQEFSYTGIKPILQEVPAHFDITPEHHCLKKEYVTEKVGNDNYSLHTEYSASGRESFKDDSSILNNYPIIKSSYIKISNFPYKGTYIQECRVPSLWTSKKWAIEFAQYILDITKNRNAPRIIEIHPPYNSGCDSLEDFIERYEAFEKILSEHSSGRYRDTKFVIENRTGSLAIEYNKWQKGNEEEIKLKFLLKKSEDFKKLKMLLDQKKSLQLRFALDLPQLLSAHSERLKSRSHDGHQWGMKSNTLKTLFKDIKSYADYITSIHLWSRNQEGPHHGNFDDWFRYAPKHKKQILGSLSSALNDGVQRYLVPEVNSNQMDFDHVINDLVNNGFEFVILREKGILKNWSLVEGYGYGDIATGRLKTQCYPIYRDDIKEEYPSGDDQNWDSGDFVTYEIHNGQAKRAVVKERRYFCYFCENFTKITDQGTCLYNGYSDVLTRCQCCQSDVDLENAAKLDDLVFDDVVGDFIYKTKNYPLLLKHLFEIMRLSRTLVEEYDFMRFRDIDASTGNNWVSNFGGELGWLNLSAFLHVDGASGFGDWSTMTYFKQLLSNFRHTIDDFISNHLKDIKYLHVELESDFGLSEPESFADKIKAYIESEKSALNYLDFSIGLDSQSSVKIAKALCRSNAEYEVENVVFNSSYCSDANDIRESRSSSLKKIIKADGDVDINAFLDNFYFLNEDLGIIFDALSIKEMIDELKERRTEI